MSVHLLSGNDESVLRDQAQDIVGRLVGDGDRGLLVDEFDGDEYELRAVADAAQTLPFLTDYRIVVARAVDRFNTADLAPLLNYLENPVESTHLVLVHSGGRVPKKLADAIAAVGGSLTNTSPPTRAKDRLAWVRGQAAEHGAQLDGQAADRISQTIGEDAGRLDGILDLLIGTYGTDQRLGVSDVEPYVGAAGDVPPWDFTDAIDEGRTSQALQLLGQMIHGGGRHPLQLMAILSNHYSRLARLDGADARDDRSAAAAMGIKPGFPAKKALKNYRRLGGPKVKRAIGLLAAADLDVRGNTGLDTETVMEVLVARLSKL